MMCCYNIWYKKGYVVIIDDIIYGIIYDIRRDVV